MAISTYSELQTAVANYLGRSDLTSRIPEFISAAEIRICDDVKVKAMEATLQGVIAEGNQSYTYPSDAHGLKGTLFYLYPSDNLLSYESTFGSWTATNGTVTSNVASITDPDEGTGADLFTRSSTAAAHLSQSYTKDDTGKKRYTLSVYAKAKTGDYVALRLAGTGSAKVDAVFNLSAGTAGTPTTTTFTEAYATITDKLMDGWYRCSVTAVSDAFTALTTYYSFNSNGEVVDGTDSASDSAGYLYDGELVSYSDRKPIEQRTLSECIVYESDETITGEPEWFSLDGTNLTFYPIPDDFYPIEGVYYKRLSLSDSTTTNWIINNYPMILVYGAMIEASVYTEDDPRQFEALYMEEVRRIKRHENYESAGSRGRRFRQVAL